MAAAQWPMCAQSSPNGTLGRDQRVVYDDPWSYDGVINSPSFRHDLSLSPRL